MAAPRRIQRRRARGWRMPEGAVHVGRPTLWGNPWGVGRPGRLLWAFGGLGSPSVELLHSEDWDAARAARAFRDWLTLGALEDYPALSAEGRVQFRRDFAVRREAVLARLPELAGRDLACWCPEGAPCHGDTLLGLANGWRL